ncbi:TonB family protein [Alteromonas sp. 1_MG-2023]|uniref:M56 family metallopeptidase n=1 Tax=Alteromonas sp. 1_MG-2023 TaxID=3062669 RepID=UPI0026E36529|nr:TonB family protein [Alteromonas sp. 1_MG-2023]MDO6474994.1 TonB family protein [Alteromonas sp. 1_MG-2023]
MTDWLLQQQVVLSVAIIFLMLTVRFLIPALGAGRAYQLWLLVPVVLIAHNLPASAVSLPVGPVSRYVTGTGSLIASPAGNTFLFIWAAGAFLIAASVVFRYVALARHIANKHLAASLHSKHYLVSPAVSTPLLFGILRPQMIMPAFFHSAFTERQQLMIIEHEQTHLRRGDHLWNALALILLSLFWFNPLVWAALSAFRTCQEVSCDAAVLSHKSQADKIQYAKALVQCAEHTTSNNTLYPAYGEKKTMLTRLTQMQKTTTGNKTITLATCLAISIFTANTALAKLAGTPVKAEQVNLAQPVMRIDPVYPAEAAANNQEGSVILKFDISATGTTENIEIVDAFPDGVFDESARAALSQWEYKPRVQGGKAMRQTGILVQLDFRLDNTRASNADEMEKISVTR